MRTSVETVDEVTVRLTVEVGPERVRPAFDRAARELAAQVAIPGFRPGKAPRRLIEQRVGQGAIARQAMDAAIGELYAEAVRTESLDVVAPPEVDVERFDEGSGCLFTATVEVLPVVSVADHVGIAVTHPDWEVAEADVDDQIDSLRERFAEVEVVDRAAAEGDLVTIDMRVTVAGEELEDARVQGALYQVGSGGVTPTLDAELPGRVAGDTVSYTEALPAGYPEHGGRDADFSVDVVDVREKRLPDPDDDFATTAAGFDSIAELRADVRSSLRRRRILAARHELRARVADAYVSRVEVTVPPSMVEGEVGERLHQLEHQASTYGLSLEDLMAAEGLTLEQHTATLREQAASSVRAKVVLDALAGALQLPFDAADLDREIVRHARLNDVEPERIADIIREQGTLPVLVGDIMRRKAIDVLVAEAVVDGGPPTELLIELGLEDAPAEAAATSAPAVDAAPDAPSEDADEA